MIVSQDRIATKARATSDLKRWVSPAISELRAGDAEIGGNPITDFGVTFS